MRLANPSLLSSYRWYEWYPLTAISQHPTMWRFLAYGQFRGTASLGIPSLTSWMPGYGVFDWDSTTNRYELTRFDSTPDYWLYDPIFKNTSFTWVSDTVVRIVGSPTKDSSGDNVRHAGKFSVSPGGNFTWMQTIETHCGYDLVNDASFFGGWAVGYNGGIVYPYADAKSTEPYPTANCFIGKITDTNSATNLGPLRSASPATGDHSPLCSLGASSRGNGYVVGVQNMAVDNAASTVYVGLYNIAGTTPLMVATTTYTGRPSALAPMHLGGGKVVVPDYNDISYNGKVSLLYTDSADTPTSITKGVSVFAPPIPFRSADVEYALPVGGDRNCQNFWVSEGKGAGFVCYKMMSNLAPGETYRYYFLPCKYISTGMSDLSVSILSADHLGNPVPIDSWWSSELQAIGNYSLQFVGGPGNKTALFWKLGIAISNTNQTIFQL